MSFTAACNVGLGGEYASDAALYHFVSHFCGNTRTGGSALSNVFGTTPFRTFRSIGSRTGTRSA